MKYQSFYNIKLPIAFNPEDYGVIRYHRNNFYIINLGKNIQIELEILKNEDGLHYKNDVKFYKNNNLTYHWVDQLVDPINKNYFKRFIGKSTYYIKDKEIILTKFTKNTGPIKPIQKSKTLLRSN
jgi:hypothetical protein